MQTSNVYFTTFTIALQENLLQKLHRLMKIEHSVKIGLGNSDYDLVQMS